MVPTPAPNGQDAASVPARAPLGVRSIEPTPAKDPSDAIIEAAETLLRAATARIAYHETHLMRLRKSLAALSSVALQQGQAQTVTGESDVLQQLVTLAHKLHDPEG